MGSRTILVTGGNRGIGRAIVEALVRDEANVAFTYCSDPDSARAIEHRSEGRARHFALDLLDADRPGTLVREVEQTLGPITGMVNNAGARKETLLAMTSDEDWQRLLEINLGGTFRCCRAVIPGMVSRRHGSIVNISSLSAYHGLPGQAAYAAAKAGVIALTRTLAREVGKRSIRVNAVVPGFVATDLTADLPQPRVDALRSMECLRAGVTPECVAQSVLFLLSDRAASITGQTLIVDAGSSA